MPESKILCFSAFKFKRKYIAALPVAYSLHTSLHTHSR